MIINSDGFGLFVFIEAWGEALGFISCENIENPPRVCSTLYYSTKIDKNLV